MVPLSLALSLNCREHGLLATPQRADVVYVFVITICFYWFYSNVATLTAKRPRIRSKHCSEQFKHTYIIWTQNRDLHSPIKPFQTNKNYSSFNLIFTSNSEKVRLRVWESIKIMGKSINSRRTDGYVQCLFVSVWWVAAVSHEIFIPDSVLRNYYSCVEGVCGTVPQDITDSIIEAQASYFDCGECPIPKWQCRHRHTYTYTYTYTHPRTHRHTQTQTDRQTDRQSDTHTHTHTHTHSHTQTCQICDM